MSAVQQLLGREGELLAVQEALKDAEAGFGRTIIVSGIAGNGKSELLKAAARLAAEQGALVLRAGGALSDGEAGFAPLLRLAGVDSVRWSPGRPVRDGGTGIRTDGDSAGSGRESIGSSFDEYLAEVASRQPVLLVLDDVQWFDGQSLDWLSSLPWRVAALKVVVLMAMSDTEACSNVAFLDNIRDGADAEFRLSRLDRTQVAAVLSGVCRSEPTDRFAAACDSVTGGIPGLVTALARALAELGSSLENTADLNRVRLSALARSLRARLRRCTPHGLGIVEAFAVLGGRANLARVTELVGSGSAEIEGEVYSLVRAGWLSGRDGHFRCAFPIIAAALVREIDEVRLAGRRVAAARAVAQDFGPSRDIADLLTQAQWAGEPWARAALAAAADEAAAGGDPNAAVLYYECAIADQPPGAAQTVHTIELGSILARVDVRAAADRLERVAQGTLTPVQRQRVAETLADVDDLLDRRRSAPGDRPAGARATPDVLAPQAGDDGQDARGALTPWRRPWDPSRRATV
ncbi:MAG: transcriptional regulator, LuxR family, partial [Actinomycetia bacterium]|nr:transcriptional regulator, LuxR family [Actinomycetes bacterium]